MPVTPDLRYDWIEPAAIPRESAWRSLHRYPLVAALLYRKGMRTAEEADAFLHPEGAPLPDPSRVPNMPAAADRIAAAVNAGETIGIFGDYDVDGVTSTTILTQALRASLPEPKVIPILPEREEGYGMNGRAVERFRSAGASLVIAVDCGSTDHEHARQITDAGMDLIIVDHHHMPDSGPERAITVSPQLDESSEFQDLTAAGLSWLVVRALTHRGIRVSAAGDSDALEYLDLVALGTVADVAPLTGFNRPIVHRGTRLIRSGRRPGIAALLQVANQDPAQVTSRTLSHTLAPRLNAAGRIATPKL
ncbi:MAG TPA: DHH family phosphoesterase, partial [Thermomicrobiales bacterium]|nr:DHH family phosphoesterase [Thermomicrobiales bacterium]